MGKRSDTDTWEGLTHGRGGLCVRRFQAANKTPQTGQLMVNRSAFLIAVEAEKSEIKLLADSVSGEGPSPGWSSIVCSLTRRKTEDLP